MAAVSMYHPSQTHLKRSEIRSVMFAVVLFELCLIGRKNSSQVPERVSLCGKMVNTVYTGT